MNQDQLIQELRGIETLPAFKVRQPWAAFLVYRRKLEEVRVQRYNYRGLVGIVASGWDTRLSPTNTVAKYPYPYEQYSVIGIGRIVGLTTYQTKEDFEKAYERHLNLPEFYRGLCYGWQVADATPIQPIYYNHSKNKGKTPQIAFVGTRGRVRIPVETIIKLIKVAPDPLTR